MDVRTQEPDVCEHSFIVARYPFQTYLHFVRSRGVGGTEASETTLAQDWREIQLRAATLDDAERGSADHPHMLPLPDEMIPLAQEARRHEAVQRSFGNLTGQWWLVEIDKAVVFQPWVDLTFVRRFQAALPRAVSHEDHIRVSAGTFAIKPQVQASHPAEDRFLFVSRSTDVRFLGSRLLDPSVIQHAQPHGHATHVVAVFLGSSINCLSALHVGNRLILMNGTHRAYALRDLGFTHVACLVTHVTNDQEKAQMLPQTVKQDEARYLISARPPMFRDYFDPAVRKVMATQPSNTLLRLHLEQLKEFVPVI